MARSRLLAPPVWCFLLATWLVAPALADDPVRVFVSVLPQKTFVEKVGGDHVQVEALIRPGNDPHTFEPTPRQVVALTEAALFVRIGMPFEEAWMRRILATNPELVVIDARDGLPLRRLEAHAHGPGEDHGHDHEHHHGHDHHADPDHETAHQSHDPDELDPHIWTSPPLVKAMSEQLRDALSRIDPQRAADYAVNQRAFAAELEALDRAIRTELADAAGRRFLVYHPAWGYFADTYGLVQVPIEYQGKEPGARSLAALIDQARTEGVQVVFVQPQFSPKAAEQVARAIGGRVESIDPLAADYAENLLRVARLIGSAGTR
ncbi:zinc ABC transporter substrate-binding protein [Thioalkalicoccus limnaeus]|uniref:High-affinity zinc uptake system protein ZnuA n=1 Tax=Thioalkalicoccus limnaeus TaxID=120681 RepID=A0ABV4BFR3_9GAMM